MSRQAPIIRQAVTPVVNGDSSPFTAAIDASSISAKPSNGRPVAIFNAPRLRQRASLQVGVGRPGADLDGALREGERRLDVARSPRRPRSGRGPGIRGRRCRRPGPMIRSARRVQAEAIEPLPWHPVRSARCRSRGYAARSSFPSASYALNARSLTSSSTSACAAKNAASASDSRSSPERRPSRSARESCSKASGQACRARASRPASSGSAPAVGVGVASLIAAIVHPRACSSGWDCKMAASVAPAAVATRSGGGR